MRGPVPLTRSWSPSWSDCASSRLTTGTMFSGPNAGAFPVRTTTPISGIVLATMSSAGMAPSLAMLRRPGLDAEQLVHVLVDLVLQLGPAQDQHSVEFVERDPVQEPPDLGQGEPEVLQGHDPVERP